ncbi:MAG: S-layer homology domain-containing protein [Actinomycetota bacterium]
MVSKSLAAACALALLASVLFATPAAASAPYDKNWALLLNGWNRASSPVIADIDADNVNEIVFGHQDGMVRAYEGNGALKWASPAVPSLNAGCAAQGSASAVDSSPAVADIDGDGTPEVIVGVGSTWAANQNGGVVVFNGKTGAREWGTALGRDTGNVWANSGSLDGWCEGVFSTPAIGDVDGDGNLDIVFAGFDFHIWAVDRTGTPLPGFPFNNDDSVWSSAALFDIDGDDDMEIFIGGDSTPGGYYDHLGGVLRALDWTPGGVVNLWNANANEVFHSSPAIGDINGDGKAEAVLATGSNWHTECAQGNHFCGPGDGSDANKVFAFHLHDGSSVPGFPVSTGDWNIGSPALGDIDNDGLPEVVVGSSDHDVYAWNGDGTLAWEVRPDFEHLGTGRMLGSPIIADLDGDGDQDVAIGGDKGLVMLRGHNGTNLEFGTIWQDRVGFGWSMESAPAVGVVDGKRHLVFTAFDTPGLRTRVAAYELPNSSAEDDWPMFRQGATRQASIDADLCGFSNSGSFCDVVASDYYADAVDWMVAEEITTGVSDLLYGPNQNLTRAQMVTFLWREAGEPTGFGHHGFVDVAANAYYADAVRWAKATGITTGTSPSTFSPNQNVTRAQLVTLLWRREGEPAAPAPAEFSDVAVGRYFTAAVGWAKVHDITTGTSPSTFAPESPVTRGQAAAFLHRAAGEPSA